MTKPQDDQAQDTRDWLIVQVANASDVIVRALHASIKREHKAFAHETLDALVKDLHSNIDRIYEENPDDREDSPSALNGDVGPSDA